MAKANEKKLRASALAPIASPSGLHFQDGSEKYVSVFRHRNAGAKKHKSNWHSGVSPAQEFGIFCDARRKSWNGSAQDHFGVRNDGALVLGQLGERLCKFPAPKNVSDDWHGYPIFGYERGFPASLSERWLLQGVISRVTTRRIDTGKI